MTTAHVGNDGTSLVLLASFPKLDRVGDKLTATYKYWCAAGSVNSLMPADGSAPPDSTVHGVDVSDLDCYEVKIEPYPRVADRVYMWVYYQDPDAVGFPSLPEAGDVIYESEASYFEAPVDTDSSMSASEIDTAIASNARVKPKATVTYFRTEYLTSFTWSETNIVANIGAIENPEDMTSPTAGKWKKTVLSYRTHNSSLVEERQGWTYDSNGWDTTFPDMN